MPEPVLPLVGLSIGVVGFVSTLRNGAQLILNDHDSFKAFGQELVPLVCEIALLTNRLDIWRRQWKISDGAPASLPKRYWGLHGGERVLELLALVRRGCRLIEDEFDRTYGRRVCQLEALSDKESRPTAISDEEDDETLEHNISNYREHFGVLGKTTRALFQGPLFRKHLDALERTVATLERYSNDEFARVWDYDANEARKHIDSFGTHFLLSKLAIDTVSASEDLLGLLESVGELQFDFQIAPGNGATGDRWDNTLAMRSGLGSIPYHLQACSYPMTAQGLNIVVEKDPKSRRSREYSTFEKAIEDWNGENETKLVVQAENSEARFSMQLERFDGQSRKPLREFLLSVVPKDLSKSLHGDFSKRDRIKLAYELAESALVFMKTHWYARLCSCAVQQVCVDESQEEHRYLIRMNKVSHLDPEGEDVKTPKWCEQELVKNHIHRIGILLVEVALGTSVKEVSYNPYQKRVEIDLGGNLDTEHDSLDLPPRQVACRVEEAAGQDFSVAVEYCLRQHIEPAQVTQRDMDRFYNKVVTPCATVHFINLSMFTANDSSDYLFTTTSRSWKETKILPGVRFLILKTEGARLKVCSHNETIPIQVIWWK